MNWWRRLNPQQKRYAAVIGIGALLALVVVLRRRSGGEEEEGGQGAVVAPAGGELGTPPFGPESTFADNGEAASALSTAITEGLGAVAEGLGGVESSQERLGERVESLGDAKGESLPAIGAGAAGEIGVPAAVVNHQKKPKKQKSPPKKTKPGGVKPPKGKPGSGSNPAKGKPKPGGPVKQPNPQPVTGGGGGVAQVGGAGGASGGVIHPNAYSSGISANKPKPNPPAGYHTYKGANGQWWFAPNN